MTDLLSLVAVTDEHRVLGDELLSLGFRCGIQAGKVIDRLLESVILREKRRESRHFAIQAADADVLSVNERSR